MVEDTGVGIAAGNLEEIFLAFHQVGDQSSLPDGTGLGLAISQKLVKNMGAELKVKSTPGKGSIFWFDLNLPDVSNNMSSLDAEGRIVRKITGEKKRVLIVDDKLENRLVLQDILTPLGFVLREATSGKECLQIVKEFEPNAILMDLLMPSLDGFATTAQLRGNSAYKNVTIIAISGNVSDEFRRKSIEVGCDSFLPKPISQSDLLDLLSSKLDLKLGYGSQNNPPSIDTKLEKELLPDSDSADIPPIEYTKILSELAIRGDIKRILLRLDQIEKLDERYKPFVNDVRKLAKRFQVKKILELMYQWKDKYEQN